MLDKVRFSDLPEVDPGLLVGVLVQAVVSLVAVELPDLAAGVEGGDDGGVLHPRPVLGRPSSGSPSLTLSSPGWGR